MYKPNRFIRTLLGFIPLIGFGFFLSLPLKQTCTAAIQSECFVLSGVTLAAITGGFIGTEMWFRKKIREGNPIQDEDDGTLDLATWSLLRSIFQAIGFILLAALPIIVIGAIGITIFGAGFGLSLSIITRGITNRFPPD